MLKDKRLENHEEKYFANNSFFTRVQVFRSVIGLFDIYNKINKNMCLV